MKLKRWQLWKVYRMTTKAISAAIAATALLFSASAASAAASQPRTVVPSVDVAKAPVSGVRAKRVLKKKSKVFGLAVLPSVLVVTAGVAATSLTVAAAAGALGPSSP